MRRKIYDRLLQWKREKDGTTALMIEGARRVGKSYIADVNPEVHQEVRAVPEHSVRVAHEGCGAEGRPGVLAAVYDGVAVGIGRIIGL